MLPLRRQVDARHYCVTVIDKCGNIPYNLSMLLSEDNFTFTSNQIKNMGTRTLFEWYRNEISQRTKEELEGDPVIKAVEHEIENRLREFELKKPDLD